MTFFLLSSGLTDVNQCASSSCSPPACQRDAHTER